MYMAVLRLVYRQQQLRQNIKNSGIDFANKGLSPGALGGELKAEFIQFVWCDTSIRWL